MNAGVLSRGEGTSRVPRSNVLCIRPASDPGQPGPYSPGAGQCLVSWDGAYGL